MRPCITAAGSFAGARIFHRFWMQEMHQKQFNILQRAALFAATLVLGLVAATTAAQGGDARITAAKVTNCGSMPGRGRQVTLEQVLQGGYLPGVRHRFS